MKIAIYSPYLDTLGGGERYMMILAQILSTVHSVDVLLDSHLYLFGIDNLKKDLGERFDLNLDEVSFIRGPVGKGSNFFNRLFFLRNYDVLFYLTDGSIFIPTAKKNILHIQSPLVGQPAKSLWGKIKLKFWNLIIYNSKFTKEHSEKNWPIKSEIIYPPVDIDKIKPLKKKKYILSVGRFFGYLKDKKHEILIKSFIDLCKNKRVEGWSLNLAGSATEGDQPYLKELMDMSKGFPINFYPNLSYDKLMSLYGQSSIYWHASGFGEDDPTKMEHFGIATVEAMAAGCVPVVIGKGGQMEIVEDKISGYLWSFLEELKEITIKLVFDNQLRSNLSKEAIKKAKDFGKERFAQRLIDLISRLN